MRKRPEHDPPSLTEKREAAELSKADLARALQCSRSLVTEWEDGTRSANEERIAQIAKVLGCQPADLRARDESGREAPAAADDDVREVRHAERTESSDLQELRGGPVERSAS